MTSTSYSVELTPAAARAIRKLDPSVSRRIRAALRNLASTPRPSGVKALSGHPGLLRIRIGDYRVVYEVQDDQLVILVVIVAHRREVYRAL